MDITTGLMLAQDRHQIFSTPCFELGLRSFRSISSGRTRNRSVDHASTILNCGILRAQWGNSGGLGVAYIIGMLRRCFEAVVPRTWFPAVRRYQPVGKAETPSGD